MTTLSLITTTYNSAATIADTMRSVAAQTCQPIEHLVMDGGSKDATLNIVRREGTSGLLVVSEPDKGFYDACNKGIARAGGEVIGFINSDDFYAHDRVVEHVLDAFADPQTDAVYGDLVYVDQADPDRVVRLWRSGAITPRSLRQGFIPAHPTVYLRRSVYERMGGFDLSYRLAADYEFLLRIFRDGALKTVYLPEIMVRMRTGGATGGGLADIRRQNDEILAARERHGVTCSRVGFFLRKLASRTRQRVDGRSVRLPATSWRA
ncbi:glycosyltransferase family 2 protein [Sphingomonas sp. 37zxx]|uniref:glycosyltransferase family 2 protein n=1 Tax=Sphingomonas sp. 37zxx TaxID=1550073 RepID=UPI00053BF777|nr:glycosyltransferase family 2 protein [Sphingomonas sp. 37zxx]